MSGYNIIRYSMACPHCTRCSEMELQAEFGVRNFIEYKVGDPIQWVPRKAVQNGGRPATGALALRAYGVCPKCDRDFFVPVEILEDRLASVDASHAHAGYEKGTGD